MLNYFNLQEKVELGALKVCESFAPSYVHHFLSFYISITICFTIFFFKCFKTIFHFYFWTALRLSNFHWTQRKCVFSSNSFPWNHFPSLFYCFKLLYCHNSYSLCNSEFAGKNYFYIFDLILEVMFSISYMIRRRQST